MRNATAIETRISEFANPDITHNVEFSLHPIVGEQTVAVEPLKLPLTSKKIFDELGPVPNEQELRNEQVLTSRRIMRNCAIVAQGPNGFTTANIDALQEHACTLALTHLLPAPFAILECKRVGVEEGMKKGPQTIEKAKQGAYVARSVSGLQKFRLESGAIHGILDVGEGDLKTGEYDSLMRKIIAGNDPTLLRNFVLSVGVVSNHGNWFTAEDHNKELKVLAHSYDWLLFLTDFGLSQFIEKLLRNPDPEIEPAKAAFLASYNANKKYNSFTKVKIDARADQSLKRYFELHEAEVESWFNVISPQGGTINQLQSELNELARKDWTRIRER